VTKVANRQFARQNRPMVPSEHQPPIDPHRVSDRAPDRRREVALDKVFKTQEIVSRVGVPVVGLGVDGPGCDLVVGRALRAAKGSGKLVKPGKFAQLSPEHAVVLREPARIVSLDVDNMAVLNAH